MNNDEITHNPTTEELWLDIGRAFLARAKGLPLTDNSEFMTNRGLCHAVDFIGFPYPEKCEAMREQIFKYMSRYNHNTRDYLNYDSGSDKMLRAGLAFQFAKEAIEKGL